MQPNILALTTIKTVILVCGTVLTWLTYKAYRRKKASHLRALCLGIGFITTGTLLAGSAHQLLSLPVVESAIIQSSFTAVGFVMLMYSLYS